MVIYVACYTLIGILYYRMGDKKLDKWKIWGGIIALSLLAGFRDQTVGTDVLVYGKRLYENARGVKGIPSLISYMRELHDTRGVELGYLFVNGVASMIFGKSLGGLFGGLFCVSLVINVGVIWGLYRIKDHISFNIAVSTYCFMFYQMTYNIMRQWMAMAVIVFGLVYVYERKPYKFFAAVLLAMTCHRTAIVAATLYLVPIYIERSGKWIRKALVVGAVLLVVFGFKSIVSFLISRIPVLMKYNIYIEGGDVSIFLPEILVRIPPIALCTVLYRPMKEADRSHETWYLLMIIELILSQLHSIMDFATRLGQYYYIAQIVEMSIACKVGRAKQRTLVKFLVITYAILYWFVMYIYFNYSETYPYTSRVLGIG